MAGNKRPVAARRFGRMKNTREAIFDSMKRKETYADYRFPVFTVRLFGGWEFKPQDAASRMPAGVGYEKGVPMGGDLHSAPQGKSASFLVAAMKDPFSGNLDRIQIVKGWMDSQGETYEKILRCLRGVMVANRGRMASCHQSANTVDVKNATWTNSIGTAELITVWKDPDFDANVPAFYYARVIEIPTPRWTAYEAKRLRHHATGFIFP